MFPFQNGNDRLQFVKGGNLISLTLFPTNPLPRLYLVNDCFQDIFLTAECVQQFFLCERCLRLVLKIYLFKIQHLIVWIRLLLSTSPSTCCSFSLS